eukprot:Seg2726.1 transcript_id=Seg2726.1/GoldUCD/mRNA.D3Y31 product="hypothetical protein" protein_id=Seg2726.1/GoldUCD/D3Y31
MKVKRPWSSFESKLDFSGRWTHFFLLFSIFRLFNYFLCFFHRRGRVSDCTTAFDYTPHLTDQCQNGTVNILEKLPADGVVKPSASCMKLTDYELGEGDVYIPLGMCVKEHAPDVPKSDRFEAALQKTMEARSSSFPPEEVMKKEKVPRERLEELFAFERNSYDEISHRRIDQESCVADDDFAMETIGDMLFAAEAVANDYLSKTWNFRHRQTIDRAVAKREAAVVAAAHFGKVAGFENVRTSALYEKVDKQDRRASIIVTVSASSFLGAFLLIVIVVIIVVIVVVIVVVVTNSAAAVACGGYA